MNDAYTTLAKLLRVDPQVLIALDEKMSAITGKKGVVEDIVEENNKKVDELLDKFELKDEDRTADKVREALLTQLTQMDKVLYEYLDEPDLSKMSKVCGKLCDVAESISPKQKGFFIKKEVAIELLEKFPPQNLLDHFGYSTVQELVDKQGFSSVFASLRFVQDKDWMHEFFTTSYSTLTADDFEERDVELMVLGSEWLDVAEKFMKKKLHNVSHLKEFGIIFITPLTLHTAGETTRMFTLLLHYLNEVPFYSKLFRLASKEPNFIQQLQSLLRGDVPDIPVPDPGEGKYSFRVIQRYLAKDDENDFRLLEPHVNPEAEHWLRAEKDLAKLAPKVGSDSDIFECWEGLDFVGGIFPDSDGESVVSFDLIDLIMSLVKKDEIKYLYHQEEALWNKLFAGYLGREKVQELIDDCIVDGFVTI